METLFSGPQTMLIGLLDYTMGVSILVCLIFIIRYATQKRLPAWWNYGLWLVLLIRMLIPVGFEKISYLFNFMPSVKAGALLGLSTIAISAASHSPLWNLQIEQALLFIWLGGIGALGIYIFLKNLKFWAIIRSRPLLIDKKLLDLLEDCKTRMNIHTMLGIVTTDKVKSPALFGYLRPRLLLPEGTLEKLNDTDLTYVFMHELGHLKRHDIGISWLLSIMQVIHWFNPLVWLAFYQMRADQESACDFSVLSRIGNNQTRDYAGTIIGFLEKFCQNRRLPSLAGVMESKSQMKRRIKMITNFKRFSGKRAIVAFAFLISVGLIAFIISGCAGVNQALIKKSAGTGRVYNISNVNTPPKISHRLMPMYPAEAKKDHIEGRVVVRMIITQEGIARDPMVMESSPKGVFDEAALAAVMKDKFIPATVDGKDVDCLVNLPIVFKLKKSNAAKSKP